MVSKFHAELGAALCSRQGPGKRSSGHGGERMAAVVDVAMNALTSTWLSPHLLSWSLEDLLSELGHTQCPCHLPSSH